MTDKDGLGRRALPRLAPARGRLARIRTSRCIGRSIRAPAILLVGDNFGCGSSREHAPWALLGAGFQAVLSTRFADIFRNNSLKNGLLVVEIPTASRAALAAAIERRCRSSRSPSTCRRRRVVLPDGAEVPFAIDAFSKHCLLNGVDQLGFLLEQMPSVERFEARASRPDRFARA